MNISTIQTTDSSSSNNDIVEMMESFSLKRKRTIKWGERRNRHRSERIFRSK